MRLAIGTIKGEFFLAIAFYSKYHGVFLDFNFNFRLYKTLEGWIRKQLMSQDRRKPFALKSF